MQALASRLQTAPVAPRPADPVPVALVITELDVGGAERALVALARGLDPARWTPAVVCLGPEGPLAAPLRASGIEVECLDVSRRRPVAAVLRLARALRRRRPRLVQSFLFHANVAGRLAAPLARVPWVLGGIRVAEREKAWHLALERRTERLGAGSVCVSQGVARFVAEAGGLSPDRLCVIPNGIDPRAVDAAHPVDRAHFGIPADAHLALFVGRLTAQKGIADLLAAASAVVAARPGWHLAIVGDGPLREDVDRFAARDPVRDRVHVVGRTDDVPGWLKAADLLVLPSLWEGMPNVVLEAMAARRAVVATSVEGSSELVEPGRTGWLVPPSSPASLASALKDAAADPRRLSAYGEAARVRIDAEYRQDRVVAAYDRLWSRVLGFSPDGLTSGGRPADDDEGAPRPAGVGLGNAG